VKKLSKKDNAKKNRTAAGAVVIKTENKQAQCCAKVSKVVAGCHD